MSWCAHSTKLYLRFVKSAITICLLTTVGATNANLQFPGSSENNPNANHSGLRSLQLKLIEQQSIRKFLGHLNILSSSKNEMRASATLFAEDAFRDVIGANQSILVFPMVVNERGMGNSLGRYLQAIGVAVEAGLHFIAIPYSEEEIVSGKPTPSGSKHRRQLRQKPSNKTSAPQIPHNPSEAFFDALHITYQHPRPTKEPWQEIVNKLQFAAQFEFPWEHVDRQWRTILDLIPRILDNAIDRYLNQTQYSHLIPLHQIEQQKNFDAVILRQSFPSNQEKRLLAQNQLSTNLSAITSDTTNPQKSTRRSLRKSHENLSTSSSSIDSQRTHMMLVPLIPDAVIVFRCNEVLQMKPEEGNKNLYGLQNFNVYTRLIPKNTTKSIYILTEPRDYNNYIIHPSETENRTWCDVCASILDNMIDFLQEHYNQAAIGVIRGHQIDSFVRIARAPVVISTASTFSFWPMMANRNHPYYQLSLLVLKDQPHHLTDTFTFITAPKHMNFGHINVGVGGQRAIDRITNALRAIPILLTNKNDASSSTSSSTSISVNSAPNDTASTPTSTLLSQPLRKRRFQSEWLKLENKVESNI